MMFLSTPTSLFLPLLWAGVLSDAAFISSLSPKTTFSSSSSQIHVRNIDLPEMIIFYDNPDPTKSILLEDDGQSPRFGLEALLSECSEMEIPASLITQNDPTDVKFQGLQLFREVVGASAVPQLRSIWEASQSVTVQPLGFGGSSGFGRKSADPPRPPLPQHVVVFCNTWQVCRAARQAGMRVICLGDNDNQLADAIIDGFDEIYSLDDVSTPGSFWLNPPHARDDDGNRVDVYSLLELNDDGVSNAQPQDGDLDLQRILDDIDPL